MSNFDRENQIKSSSSRFGWSFSRGNQDRALEEKSTKENLNFSNQDFDSTDPIQYRGIMPSEGLNNSLLHNSSVASSLDRSSFDTPNLEISTNDSSILTSGSTIKGEISFENEATLDSYIEGTVSGESKIIFGPNSEVNAKVEAEEVVVYGKFSGSIVCSKRITLENGASVFGKMISPRIVMCDGVHFEGECKMPEPKSEQASSAQDTAKVVNS
jgi:cytoskeletal protein CcmA (bactofilin family)